jgi:cell division protein FtsX
MTLAWTWRRIGREARRHAGSLTALAAAMAFAAAVTAAAVLGARTAAGLVPLLEQNVHVIAYLDDQIGAPEQARLVQAVRQVPGVAAARLVEPEEAMAQLRAAVTSLGGGGAVGALEPGFLPRSVEIAVAPGPSLPARTTELAARLRQIPGVREVDSMTEGVARLLSWIALGRRVAWGALALAVLAALSALLLALVAARGRRRDEAAVLTLLGESPSGIRRPVCLATSAAAVIGASVGLGALLAVFPRAVRELESAIGLGSLGHAPTLDAKTVALTLAAALLIGWLAGRIVSPRAEARDA